LEAKKIKMDQDVAGEHWRLGSPWSGDSVVTGAMTMDSKLDDGNTNRGEATTSVEEGRDVWSGVLPCNAASIISAHGRLLPSMFDSLSAPQKMFFRLGRCVLRRAVIMHESLLPRVQLEVAILRFTLPKIRKVP
jgi:hypothetical protein